MTDRRKQIEDRLVAAFSPSAILVKDQSHLHAGHAGAADGKGHFAVDIAAESFAGLSRIQCHQLVFEALGSLMDTDIHALAIKARAPNEPNSL